MPNWKGHLIVSLFLVIAWISIFYFADFQLDFWNLPVLIILTIFASLFPDVDMKRSKIRDVFSFVIAAILVGAYVFFYTATWYYAPVYFILLYLILKYLPTKHRGIAHTFKFSVLFSLVIASIYFTFARFSAELFLFWFLISFSSYNLHLLLDKK